MYPGDTVKKYYVCMKGTLHCGLRQQRLWENPTGRITNEDAAVTRGAG